MGEFWKEGFEGNSRITYIPSKVVYTIKPPDQGMDTKLKRKARIVACGKYSKDDGWVYMQKGVSGEILRRILAEAAPRRWAAGLMDVQGAFMLTPMADVAVTAVKPPSVLISIGLVEKGERWILIHVMDVFHQFPRLWSGFRDDHLLGLKGTWEGKDLNIQGEMEANLREIMAEDSICGAILAYADAFLVCGSSSLIAYVAKMVAGLRETTAVEMASTSIAVRFLGWEICDLEPGFSIDQLPYIKELLRAHGVSPAQFNVAPCPYEWLGGDDDQLVESAQDEIRQAQRIPEEV